MTHGIHLREGLRLKVIDSLEVKKVLSCCILRQFHRCMTGEVPSMNFVRAWSENNHVRNKRR